MKHKFTRLFRALLGITSLAVAVYPVTGSYAQTIGAGSFHSMVLCPSDSSVRSWGANNNGQLGINDTIQQISPVRVKGPGGVGYLNNIISIVARENFSLALKNDGTVWSWGFNGDGEMGDSTTTDKWAPVQVHGPANVGFLSNIKAISGGYAHVLALKNDSTVWAWGDNTNGELGDNTTVNELTPVQVIGPGGVGVLNHIVAIAAGQQFSLALKNDGTVWAWGNNADGAIGDNTSIERHTPVQVLGPLGVGFLTGITALAAGGGHAVALKNDSTVWSWGFNINGELGNNTAFSDSVPAEVLGPGGVGHLTGIMKISTGDYFSAGIKGDNTVWIWGFNAYGQLGQNDTVQRNVPVEVHGVGNVGFLSGIVAISLGDEHAVALKNDNTYWAWGWNGNGQLGDDSTTDSHTPVAVSSPCSALGVASVQEAVDNIDLYPNPAGREITLVNNEGNTESIVIYNMLGEKAYEAKASPHTSLMNIDISALPNGLYLARITTAGGIVNKKFIVAK